MLLSSRPCVLDFLQRALRFYKWGMVICLLIAPRPQLSGLVCVWGYVCVLLAVDAQDPESRPKSTTHSLNPKP